jgi:aminoglycoside phosphotransferase (APT) family kinase protein
VTDGNPAKPVRDEDAFDTAAVQEWLGLGAIEEVRQFPGGASNLTYLLRLGSESGGRELILRRPPSGQKAAGAHDMGREHRIQAALKPVFPYVPEMVGYCEDESVIGSPFYVMAKVDGLVPRRELPESMTRDDVSALCGNAWDVLAELHSVDVAAHPELAALGRGEGYVGRQVAGWTSRFAKARTDDTGDWSDVEAWIVAHQPSDVAQVLIHNDFRLDNLVVATDDPTRVVGVLDWEMATVGDPLMDLGGSMSYWVEEGDDDFFQMFRRQPSQAPGMWTRAEIVSRYTERMGYSVSPEQWRFYEVFGLYRLAVIAQQIWYRYFHGQTTNEQYAVFGPAVGYLETRCRRLIAEAG